MTEHGGTEPGTASGPSTGGRKLSSGTKLLTHSQARYLAESVWGRGETVSHRTNRTGAFWFSCAGHGGFVIDDRALTREERERLAAAGLKADACWGVRGEDGQIITVRHPGSQVRNPRPVFCHPDRGEYQDRKILVWTLEQDCEWAAAYAFTGIRAPSAFSLAEDGLMAIARESYPQAAGSAGRLSPGETPCAPAPLPAARARGRTAGGNPSQRNRRCAPGS